MFSIFIDHLQICSVHAISFHRYDFSVLGYISFLTLYHTVMSQSEVKLVNFPKCNFMLTCFWGSNARRKVWPLKVGTCYVQCLLRIMPI